MSDRVCISCRYWARTVVEAPGVPGIPGTPAQGECHRYAPRPSVGTGHTHVLWPLTSAADACGEWDDADD